MCVRTRCTQKLPVAPAQAPCWPESRNVGSRVLAPPSRRRDFVVVDVQEAPFYNIRCLFALQALQDMTADSRVAIDTALKREGFDPTSPADAGMERRIAAALALVSYAAPVTRYPNACHLLAVAYLIGPMNKMRWRVYEEPGYPAPDKLPPLVQLWCSRLPTWSPEKADAALRQVRPFGRDTGVVSWVIYQWLRGTWNSPVMPPDAQGVTHIRGDTT